MKSGTSTLKKLFPWVGRKHVYFFDEGTMDEQELLGAKGANLCDLFRLGLPVPNGFVVTTEASKEFFAEGDATELSANIASEIVKSIHRLERETTLSFGTSRPKGSSSDVMPLLLSIRSAAPILLPGMTQSILNLGINDDLVKAMARLSSNSRWAYDTYRRFLQEFGNVVLGIDNYRYLDILFRFRQMKQVESDSQLSDNDLKQIVEEFKEFTLVPHDPFEQLRMAVVAVFKCWNSPPAVQYRDINNIPTDLGVAVVIQSMVYGNMNDQSGVGTAFTRNPITGAKEVAGQFFPNSEGMDVGAIRKVPLIEMQTMMPKVFQTLLELEHILEKHYRDAQLFILEAHKLKRSPLAAVKIAVDMVGEKFLTEREALLRLDSSQMNYFVHPMINHTEKNYEVFDQGSSVSIGAAQGQVVFTSADACRVKAEGLNCILCCDVACQYDMAGMQVANGLLTAASGNKSHAGLLMSELGKPVVVCSAELKIDVESGQITSKNGGVIKSGEVITIDGTTGSVYKGEVALGNADQYPEFQTVLGWADKYKNLYVFASADTPLMALKAVEFGADGIGLLRSEQILLKSELLKLFRRAVLEEEHDVTEQLLQLQQQEFLEMFRMMRGLKTTIRLLDPPIHEFFPSPGTPDFEEEVYRMSGMIGRTSEYCISRIQQLQEKNPLIGCRGCRLSILRPEILDMQVRAIISAALEARTEGIPTAVNVSIPLVFSDHELDCVTPRIMDIAETLCLQEDCTTADIGLHLGAMIETPRACLRADKIAAARNISFIEFETKNLTQLAFGLSREDSQQFMPIYLQKHIVARDPFETLDFHALGPLIHLAVKRSREGNPNIQIGMCGQHGSDINSVYFFEHNNFNYVSCSPYHIPSAKVAAAQSRIEFVAREKSKELELSRRAMHNFFFLY